MKDERGLLRAARRLNQDALITIFDTYAPAIYKYILRFSRVPIEADQMVGRVFTELLEKFSTGQGPQKNLRFFLYQIAYHLVVDRINHPQRFPSFEVVVGFPKSTSTLAAIEDPILIEALLAILYDELPSDQRHVLVLRFLEDFSLQETAAIVGKNPNSVKAIQNLGIEKLRSCLGFQAGNDQHE